jgi:exopolyphosphatase/guanosine-5'-triphosphate,3'-diphosphate pyrophosphatase
MKRVAVIDLGSNAVRLKIAEVTSLSNFKVIEKIRLPIRIGEDVFQTGAVTTSKIEELVVGFKQFRAYIDRYHVQEIEAVATSALRDAENSILIIKKIEETTNIKLRVISGIEEANLIYQIIAHEIPIMTGKTLLIDIGGGSTELSAVNEGILQNVQSFNVGTLRILNDNKSAMTQLIESIQFQATGQQIKLIGTGGNLRRIRKLRKKIFSRADPTIIHKSEALEMFKYLKDLSALQLMKKYDLKHDHAEIMVPALKIFTTILNEINVEIIHLPKIGLLDSLILKMSSIGNDVIPR